MVIDNSIVLSIKIKLFVGEKVWIEKYKSRSCSNIYEKKKKRKKKADYINSL